MKIYKYVVTIILCLILSFNVAHSLDQFDSKTFCPKGGSKEQTILLIDATDSLTPVSDLKIQELIKSFQNKNNEYYIKPGHELIVYHLSQVQDSSKSLKAPFLRICNPGNPKDRTLSDSLMSGKYRSYQIWKNFRNSLRKVYSEVKNQKKGKQSPLLESISLITAKHMPRLGTKEHKPTLLIIFSDMLQNSDYLSHYGSLPKIDKLKTLSGYNKIKSNLSQIDVWIIYIQRTVTEKLQTSDHYYWWTKIIKYFGGNLIKQEPV